MLCVRLYLFPRGLWEAPDLINTFLNTSPPQGFVLKSCCRTNQGDPNANSRVEHPSPIPKGVQCLSPSHPSPAFDVSQMSGALLELVWRGITPSQSLSPLRALRMEAQ